tara:strand:+ start:584 stop:820 length:237 start_codon:yes stop_codon:yes gene_type:complete
MNTKQFKHHKESNDNYKIFVNGRLLNSAKVYDFAMNRALGIAMLLGLEFKNTRSNLIMDKWIGEKGMVLITKNNISEL